MSWQENTTLPPKNKPFHAHLTHQKSFSPDIIHGSHGLFIGILRYQILLVLYNQRQMTD